MTSIMDDMNFIKQKSDEIRGICTEPDELAEIVHEQAEERCTECGWNTTVSDELAAERPEAIRTAVDDWDDTGVMLRECPWCNALTNDNPHTFGNLIK